MPTMQASRAVWPFGPPARVLKKLRPKSRPVQVFCPISEMPYLAATEGTLTMVWQRMGHPVHPLPRTVYCQALSPRKKTALLDR